ncbi:MAG: LysR substrate-binding domain-containing protein [Halopseudomonas aestusnigri]
MKLPPLNALKTFEAAARHQNFSRAGDELCVTHAAVSHQIKNLENWFGKKLFRRKNRRVHLTRAGQLLLSHISVMFEELAYVCQGVKSNGQRNILSVGCIPSIATRWLIPHIGAFSLGHDDIELQVLYAQADSRLSDGDYDVLITLGEDTSSHVKSEKIFSRATRPVCSPGFLERHPDLSTPGKIATANLLHDETKQDWQNWITAARLVGNNQLSGPVFQDTNLMATAVIAGHGIALCPVEVYRDEIVRGDLIILSEIEINSDAGYFITTENERSKTTEVFVDWFKAITVESK